MARKNGYSPQVGETVYMSLVHSTPIIVTVLEFHTDSSFSVCNLSILPKMIRWIQPA
jgi:hypothetical protein